MSPQDDGDESPEVNQNGEEVTPPTVAELRQLLLTHPDEMRTWEAVTAFLAADAASESKSHQKQMETIVEELPGDSALMPRSLLAWLQGKDEECIDWAVKAAKALAQKHPEPMTGTEVCEWFVNQVVSDVPKGYYAALADAFQELLPDSAPGFILRGAEHILVEEYQEAAKQFEQVLQRTPTCWLAARSYADSLFGLGEYGKASDSYEKALALAEPPEAEDIQYCAAWNYSCLGDYRKESAAWKKCLKLFPDDALVRRHLGLSLELQGKFQEALGVFQKCVDDRMDGKVADLHRVRLLKKVGRKDDSREEIKRLRFGSDSDCHHEQTQNSTDEGEPKWVQACIGHASFPGTLEGLHTLIEKREGETVSSITAFGTW